MPNNLTFSVVVPVKNLTGANIVRQRFDDDANAGAGEAIVEVQLTGGSATIWPTVYPLAVRNGSCDAIVVQTNPTLTTDVVLMERLSGGAGIATLYTDCNTAQKARTGDPTVAGQVMTNNGRTNVLRVLQAAVGNRAAGASPATATVLPAGTVT
jgi:hypothetical protein